MANKTRLLWILVSVAVVALILLGAWLVQPAIPPASIRLATGPEGEQEHQTALRYKEYMAKEGVAVEVVPTAGSLASIALVQSGDADVAFALNASNLLVGENDTVTRTSGIEDLVGIAAVGYVPQWVFYRSELETDGPLTGYDGLKGKRVAMGEPGSGTRAIGLFLLAVSDISTADLEIVDASPSDAMAMLESGEIDAMFLSSGVSSPTVLELLAAKGVEVLNVELAPTYSRVISLLEHIVLLRGSYSISAPRPPADKNMLAVASVLIAKQNFSPDIQLLLTRAARDTAGQALDLFPTEATFPTVEGLTSPASEVTTRFINEGQTFLQRYLPFWIASPLERFYLLLLPLFLILFPIISKTPAAYTWTIRRRFYPWYKRLRETELHMKDYSVEDVQVNIRDFETAHRQINELLNVPTSYVESVYNLRFHIELVLARLRVRLAELQAAATAPEAVEGGPEKESMADGM